MAADPAALLRAASPQLWFNPLRDAAARSAGPAGHAPLQAADMLAARDRLVRFAPLLAQLFPELAASHGQIESPLTPVPQMQQALGLPIAHGRLWVKADHSLPVAGSIKARGGFHEVLEWAEQLGLQHGLLSAGASGYARLAQFDARALFSRHQVAVGSTGNLGMAIGVMAAALGFRATVHMSTEAKAWKKDRLRRHGVEVVEHTGDYEQAVAQGRQRSLSDPLCHFVDDEGSLSLFVGYSAAALHLREQLQAQGVVVDAEHPLLVYVPCGVGGAPSGIAWGLQQVFGPHVHCFFAEPVQSPCFLVQMLAEPGSHPSIYELGLTNQTQADGLAIPRASLLATQAMRNVLAGCFTVEDATLFQHLRLLHASEGMRVEPSAAAGFSGPLQLAAQRHQYALAGPGSNHVVWTTGGLLVPEAQFQEFLA